MKRKRAGGRKDAEPRIDAAPAVAKTPTNKVAPAQDAISNSGARDGSSPSEGEEMSQRLVIRQQDRSARRKTARRAVERTLSLAAAAAADGGGDMSSGAEEMERQLWDDDEDDDNDDDDGNEDVQEEHVNGIGKAGDAGNAVPLEPETPTKRKRGRPRKDPARAESPPSINMSSYERYFWDNRTGAGKTSNNVFAPGMLLDHDGYFEQRDAHQDEHVAERAFLQALHESAFGQWAFEMANEFNVCLYGYGSKRGVTRSLAEYLHETIRSSSTKSKPSIFIVNGYVQNITMVDVLTSIASTMFPQSIKLPSTVATLLPLILETLDKKTDDGGNLLYLLVNSIDAPPLRKLAAQSILATLAAHQSVRLIATVDSPNFPLLWDAPLRSRFRFLFHDCTTFAPLDSEVVDAVDSVATLLGMKTSRIGGKDGVTFVLRSLPENARHLFRILVAEQVSAGVEANDTAANSAIAALGVEYRVLYHKAREELVCSTEHQLRTLLKEFYDHQMVQSRRDALGTERLLVPFKQDELESLLEDLVE